MCFFYFLHKKTALILIAEKIFIYNYCRNTKFTLSLLLVIISFNIFNFLSHAERKQFK